MSTRKMLVAAILKIREQILKTEVEAQEHELGRKLEWWEKDRDFGQDVTRDAIKEILDAPMNTKEKRLRKVSIKILKKTEFSIKMLHFDYYEKRYKEYGADFETHILNTAMQIQNKLLDRME